MSKYYNKIKSYMSKIMHGNKTKNKMEEKESIESIDKDMWMPLN